MIATILAAWVGVVQTNDAFLPSRDFILTKSGAVGLLPPISVCDFAPERVAWSDDGNRLLIVRRNPKLSDTQLFQNLNSGQGQRSVVIFDAKSRKSREVLSFPESQGAVTDMAWFGNGQSFFLVTRTGTRDTLPNEVQYRLYIGNIISSRVVLAYTGQLGESIGFCPSPKHDLGAMIVSRAALYQRFSSWGKIVLGDGRLGPSIEAPENALFRFREEAWWSQDGNVVVLPFLATTPGFSINFIPFDTSSGRRTEVPTSQYVAKAAAEEFSVWEIKEKRAAEEHIVEKSSLWLVSMLRGSRGRAFIVGDGNGAVISPSKNAIFYICGGIGVVRPLVSTPREEFLKLLSTEERNRLTAELQQCIKVFKEWVLEENLEFPTPEEWAPKAKSWSLSRPEIVGFIYTFKGGQLTAGRQSQTVFGYKQGETGRATCYMDGRVVWKAN